jgi:hypothetical protein
MGVKVLSAGSFAEKGRLSVRFGNMEIAHGTT